MNLFVSIMRSVVPVVVGLVLGLAARVGLDLDEAEVAAAVTAGLTAVYYTAFRALEELAGRLGAGWLATLAGVALGWARPPDYGAQPKTAEVRLTLDTAAFGADMAELVRRHTRRDGQ